MDETPSTTSGPLQTSPTPPWPIAWLVAGLVLTTALTLAAAHAPPRIRLIGLFSITFGALLGLLLVQLAVQLESHPSPQFVAFTAALFTTAGLIGCTWETFRLEQLKHGKSMKEGLAQRLVEQMQTQPDAEKQAPATVVDDDVVSWLPGPANPATGKLDDTLARTVLVGRIVCGRSGQHLGRSTNSDRQCSFVQSTDDTVNMIIGLGTDIVEVERIKKMMADHGDHFLERVFTPDEIAHCQPRRESAPHYAGRWAAKEAVMKVLGTGFTTEVGWTDIEIAVKPSGQPYIRLHGSTKELAERLGITEILVTMSHTKNYATATAIGVREKKG